MLWFRPRSCPISLTPTRHTAMFGSRQLRLCVVVAAVVLAVAGCRTPVEQEGDLDVQLFERPGTSLATGPGGEWFVVARRGESPDRFLTVDYDDETHLFVTDPIGERSAEILPLTRVDIDWFNEALESTPRLRFHGGLEGLEIDGTLGLWQGGDTESIVWLGDRPESPRRGVVLPVDLDIGETKSMPAHIEGTVTTDAEGLVERHDPFPEVRGPYLVVPDGPVTDLTPRAAATGETELAEMAMPGLDWEFGEVSTDRSVRSVADVRELAGMHGVELMAARQDDEIRVGFAADGGPPKRAEALRPVALAESGFVIDGQLDAGSTETALRAADDMYRDHPLSAAYRLQKLDPGDQWHVDDNPWATELRHQDLVAAADFAPWMRTRLVGRQQALGPDIKLYLVRALTYMGRWEAVLRYADGTLELFDEMPETTRAVGAARTRVLMADAHRARGDRRAAAESLEVAGEDFQRAGDTYRAGLVERRRRLLTDQEDNFLPVVETLQRAGADYESSRTLLLAAAEALVDGRLETSREHFEMWRDRFGEEAPRGLVAMSWALQERLEWRQTGHPEHRRDFEEQPPRWDALVLSGLTRYDRRGLEEPVDLAELGELLVEGTRRSDADLFDDEVDRALGVVCTDVLYANETAGQPEWLRLECDRRTRRLAASPVGVSSLLDGGQRFVQLARLSAAAQLEELLLDELSEGPRWALTEGRVLLYRAARLIELANPDDPGGGDDEADPIETIREAFEVLEEGLSEDEAPGVLRSLGMEYDARGFDRHALALYDAARRAADRTGAEGAEFEAALELARLRTEVHRWDDLAAMDNVASPLHAVRIDLRRGHAELMRGDAKRGNTLVEQSLRRASEFGELQQLDIGALATWLAVERGEFDRAWEHLERTEEVLDGLPESVAGRDERRVLEARLRLLARFVASVAHRQEPPLGPSDEQFARVQRLLEEVPPEMVVHVDGRIVAMAADSAADRDELDRAHAVLERMWRYSAGDRDVLRRDLARGYATILVADDRIEAASRVVESTLEQGLGVDGVRFRHHCLLSRIRQFEDRSRLAGFHLERCGVGDEDRREQIRTELLAAMADPDAVAGYRVELVELLREHLPPKAAAEDRRLEWIAGFSRARTEDETEEARQLREDLDEAEAPRRREIAAELIELLVDAARYEEADELLETRTELFFDDEDRASASWHRWRAESKVRQLRPFRAFDYIDRALEEGPEWTDDQQARLHFLRAVAHLQLRQTVPALDQIEKARDAGPGEQLTDQIGELESKLVSNRSDP